MGALAKTVPNLFSIMKMAYDVSKTDTVIIFDGNFGYINCSPTIVDLLKAKAPEVSKKVDEELLLMWLEQRGLEI